MSRWRHRWERWLCQVWRGHAWCTPVAARHLDGPIKYCPRCGSAY